MVNEERVKEAFNALENDVSNFLDTGKLNEYLDILSGQEIEVGFNNFNEKFKRDVPDYDNLFAAIKSITSYDVFIESYSAKQNLFVRHNREDIIIKEGQTQAETLKMLIRGALRSKHAGSPIAINYSNINNMEVMETDSLEYILCSHFNIYSPYPFIEEMGDLTLFYKDEELKNFIYNLKDKSEELINKIEQEMVQDRTLDNVFVNNKEDELEIDR